MKHLLLAAALVLPASVVAQPVCEMRDAPLVPVFEPAKAAFLAGRWDTFAEMVTPLVPEGPAAFGDTLARLKVIFPNGFEGCETVLHRADAGGTVQQITVYSIPGAKGPMSLYLMASPFKGEMTIGYFYLNTAMRDVFDKLM